MAHLTMSRTKTIMRTAVGADSVSKEAILITTRAAELFIKALAKEGYKDAQPAKKLQYNNLVKVVSSNSRYEFLETIIPKKITVREYKQIMKKKQNKKAIEESSSESESSEDSDSEESEEESSN